jgi:hypothetical protein
MFDYACPACCAVLTAPDHAVGRKATCPKCGQRLRIPPPPWRTVFAGLRVLSMIGRFFCFVVVGAVIAVLVALLLLVQFWLKYHLGIDIPLHHAPEVFRK